MKLAASIPLYLDHVAAHNEPSTLDTYRQRLAKFETYAGRRAVKRPLVNEWIQHLRNVEQLSKRTVVHYRRTLRSFYAWLVENEIERANPVSKALRLPTSHAPKVPFTTEELDRLLTLAAGHEFWEYAVTMGCDTGLRLSDVALMQWSGAQRVGVDLAAKSVRWVPKKTQRFEKVVEIPLSERCVTVLERMRLASRSDYVSEWLANQFNADAHRTISTMFIRFAAKAHVYDKSFHNLRATFVTRCLIAGLSPALVSSMTGHALNEIMSYATFTIDTKREALLKLAVNL